MRSRHKAGLFVLQNLGTAVARAPDEIRFDADDGVAAARFPALYALEQEGVVAGLCQFQPGRDRCLEIGNPPREQYLAAALAIIPLEDVEIRLDLHRSSYDPPVTRSTCC